MSAAGHPDFLLDLLRFMTEKPLNLRHNMLIFYICELIDFRERIQTGVMHMKRKKHIKTISIIISIVLFLTAFFPSYKVYADEGMERAYYTDEAGEDFTEEELEFIRNCKTLKVGYISDDIPVSYKDSHTGECEGISRAIFDKLSEVSGLKFDLVALPEGTIKHDYLQSNGFDLVTGVELNETNLNIDNLYLSQPYFSGERVIVCKEEFEFDVTREYNMAIATGSVTFKDVVAEYYPKFNINTYDTVEESFDAVYDESQDMLLVNRYIASYWMAKPKYGDFTIVPIDGMDDSLCFSAIVNNDGDGGLSPEDSEMVINIIDKTIGMISADEMDNLIVRETMKHHYEYTFCDFLYMYRISIIVVAVLFLAVLITMISMYKLKKKHEEQRRAEERNIILQQKRYKMIIDNSEELIYEISLFGEPCIASEKIKEKFGWDIPKQVDNLSIRTLSEILHVHPADEDQFYSSTEGLVANKEVKELLIRLGKANGTYIWCNVIYLPIIDDDGNMVSIVGKIVDVDDSVREKKRLEFKSRTDSLTGLLNKKTFEDETRNYIEENTAVSSAFIFVDMDFFKNVNDLLGHVMGDQVIKDTAVKLQVIFANCDLVARFGGDEYCIFVKDIPSDTLVDKLNFAIDKLSDIYTNNGARVSLTASIGAAYCSSPSIGYDQLLECADKAVYRAKEEGKNRYIITYM